MEENIELCLVSDKEIHNDILQALLKYINPEYYIDSIQAMDDWTYSNLVDIDDINLVDDYIALNRIVTITCSDYFMNRVGVSVEKKKDKYHYDGWFKLSDECSEEKYARILEELEVVVREMNPDICAIGREMYVDLDLPVNEIKSEASGVDIWISKT